MFARLSVQRRVGGFEEVEVSFHASLAGVGCIKLLLQRPQLGLVQPLSLRERETEREGGRERDRERGRERDRERGRERKRKRKREGKRE